MLAITVMLRRAESEANPESISAALKLASVYFERAIMIESVATADLEAAWQVCTELRRRRPEHPRVLLQMVRLALLKAQRASAGEAAAESDLAAARELIDELRELVPLHPELEGAEQWSRQVENAMRR